MQGARVCGRNGNMQRHGWSGGVNESKGPAMRVAMTQFYSIIASAARPPQMRVVRSLYTRLLDIIYCHAIEIPHTLMDVYTIW